MVNRFINSMLFFNARVFLYRRRDRRPKCPRKNRSEREGLCVCVRERERKGRGMRKRWGVRESVCVCVCACER
jgi:hypothetical protein